MANILQERRLDSEPWRQLTIEEEEPSPRSSYSSILNYQLGRTLGEGKYSVVKSAVHLKTRQDVAIKIVYKSKLDLQEVNVLTREMEVLKLLNHPNIVKLYEIIDTGHVFYLVQELVQGTTLQEYLLGWKDIGVGEDFTRKIFHQLLSAIQYCHAKRVVHRDMKPNNIMLNANGTVKIIDFGLSRTFDNLISTHCGTPLYAAPELYLSDAYIGPAVDIWAIGVIMYRMMVGHLPFVGPGYLSRIKEGIYRPPMHSSDHFKDIIARMLELDGAKRATAEDLISHPWTNYQCKLEVKSYTDVPLIDCQVLGIMAKFGYPSEEIIKAIKTNLYNHITATYCLLLAQKEQGCNLDIEIPFYLPPPAAVVSDGVGRPLIHADRPEEIVLCPSLLALSRDNSGGNSCLSNELREGSSSPALFPRLERSHTGSSTSGTSFLYSAPSSSSMSCDISDNSGRVPGTNLRHVTMHNNTYRYSDTNDDTAFSYPTIAEVTLALTRPGLRFMGAEGSINIVSANNTFTKSGSSLLSTREFSDSHHNRVTSLPATLSTFSPNCSRLVHSSSDNANLRRNKTKTKKANQDSSSGRWATNLKSNLTKAFSKFTI